MRILIIDDDPDLLIFLKNALEEERFVVDVAKDGASGISLAALNTYDVIVLDLNLPDINGEVVCKKLRKKKGAAPILMLTAIGDTSSKVRLLNAGADDYMPKPFSLEELIARIRALLRRPKQAVSEMLKFNDIEIDTQRQAVMRGKKKIVLTRKEYLLLVCLVRNAGSIVSKQDLIEYAWDSSFNPFSNALDMHLVNIRKKMGEPRIIKTFHGRGYQLG